MVVRIRAARLLDVVGDDDRDDAPERRSYSIALLSSPEARERGRSRTGDFVGIPRGYIVAWASFSGVAASAQWALEAQGIVSQSMMSLTESVPWAFALIAAGVFQFTPLKQACLRYCRSPAEFITQHSRSGTKGAIVMGLDHGAHCLGCCWFLMALQFVGGIINLYWIVGLAVLVAFEKLTPYGVIISKIVGLALIAWGAFVVFVVF